MLSLTALTENSGTLTSCNAFALNQHFGMDFNASIAHKTKSSAETGAHAKKDSSLSIVTA